MGDNSQIQWTEASWNPVTGCTKISAGCKFCCAERMTARLQAMGQANYRNGFNSVTTHPHMLDQPLKWKRPRRIFVNSMSDLFHQDIPELFIRQVFDVMRRAHWHTFQVLTKRSSRLLELGRKPTWPSNVWMGVSIEDWKPLAGRLSALRQIPCAVRWISAEPLIGPLEGMNLEGIHWVVVGGESGPGCRPMDIAWARDIQRQCKEQGVSFFMKQLGGHPDKRGDLEQSPIDLRVREYPV